jgi:hypothetical protein
VINFKTFQTLLSKEDRDELLALLPDADKQSSDEDMPLTDSFFKYQVYLNESIEGFQDALYLGYLDPANAHSLNKLAEKNNKNRWKVK